MAKIEQVVADVPPWHAASWKHFPFRSALYLVFAVISAFGSLIVLHFVNGQPVENWTTPPTVYLSILVLVARSSAEGAFKHGIDGFWWNQLLSERGTSLRDLHHTWESGRTRIPLLQWHRPWNLVRSAGLSMLVLGAAGPLVQRSLTVEQATPTSEQQAVLPVRIEPMWNLTVINTNGHKGYTWSPPMYQPEFAKIVVDYTHRKPPFLAGGGFCSGSCDANVTVAGFARTCTERHTSPEGLPYLWPAQNMVVQDREYKTNISVYSCSTMVSSTNYSSASPCDLFRTYYQLAVELDSTDDSSALLYTSYVRPDPRNDSLLVQQCTFFPAFIRMAIVIANDSSIALSERLNPPLDNILEFIDPPTKKVDSNFFLGGFLQVMRDAYEGYVIWDTNEESNMVLGSGPRLYAEAANVTKPLTYINNQNMLAVGFRSPLDDFTNTLNEMTLRYALVDIPDTDVARVADNENYILSYMDTRNTSLPKKTAMSKSQNVVLVQSRTVPVFRANYAYAIAASSIVLLATLATVPLLRGCRRAGRKFSVSPLEVAKAFNAPLFGGVASGAPVETIVRVLGGLRVRYGEARGSDNSPTRAEVEEDVDSESANMVQGGHGQRDGTGRRLMIELVDRVVSPKNGVRYTR